MLSRSLVPILAAILWQWTLAVEAAERKTPLNSRVVELVHAMERGGRRPDRDAFDELRVLLA